MNMEIFTNLLLNLRTQNHKNLKLMIVGHTVPDQNKFPYEPSSALAVLQDFSFLVAQSLCIHSAAFTNPSSIGSQKLCAAKWFQF